MRWSRGVLHVKLPARSQARVAAKVLHNFNAGVLARFKREFRSAVELRHENLVRLYELFSEGEQWFYTKELVCGSTFLEYVRPQGELSIARLRSAFSQLAHAVEALHRAKRLHRDLKPANVLVTPEGRAVLLDFGLMRPAAVPVEKSVTMAGTPAYMAPEQLLQLPATAASDWYAVGVMLHEALVGRRPSRVSETRPGPETNEGSADLWELCIALLREQPGERPTGPQILLTVEECAEESQQTAIETRPIDHVPFVGRTDILAALDSAFSQVQEDSLRVVLLEGQSGIGKSATIRHFLRESEKRYPDLIVLTGRCYEFETVPYKGLDVLIDELANYLQHLP
jgi:serine/threonine protein kinase